MPPALLALFLLVGSFGVITIATLAYVFFHRADTRFTLVISLLLVCVVLVLSPLVFLHPLAFPQGPRSVLTGGKLSSTADKGGHCLFLPQRLQQMPGQTEEEDTLLTLPTASVFRVDRSGAHCSLNSTSPLR